MPPVWLSLRKSLQCRSEDEDVHHPQSITVVMAGKKLNSCSNASVRNKFIKRIDRFSSHRSRSSDEFSNTFSREVMLIGDYNCQCGVKDTSLLDRNKSSCPCMNNSRNTERKMPVKCVKQLLLSPVKFKSGYPSFCNGGDHRIHCKNCGQQFRSFEALQSHHQSYHAVTDLSECDLTRRTVECIFKTSWLESGIECKKIEKVIKVNNTQSTLARFEEYREAVKCRAGPEEANKNGRCLADGNEVLRFHGTTILCSLGTKESSSLCDLEDCNVCKIIRTGFACNGKGIYTTATSGRAHCSINLFNQNAGTNKFSGKRAILICRVIAGRVHGPVDSSELTSFSSACFDSVAGRDDSNWSGWEELFVFNPRAVLPCFVIVYS